MRTHSPVIRQRVIVPSGYGHTYSERRLARLERVIELWWLFVGTIVTLVAFRFGLLLFGANQENIFAGLLLAISQPLVAPFLTLFGSPEAGRAVMELPDLVAIIAYLLVGIGVDRLLRVMLAPPDPTGQAYRT